MAKERSGTVPTPSPQPANEGSVKGGKLSSTSKASITLPEVAVPTFGEVNAETIRRAKLIEESKDRFTDLEIQQLMSQVKIAQRNLTESLNGLSEYRKVVAHVLETRRREAAKRRKEASVKEAATPFGVIEATPIDTDG